MGTFVLIMTVVVGGMAPTVGSTPGFTSIEACQTAGNTWKSDIDSNHSFSRVNTRYVCVSLSK